ncbi:MAG: phosphate acyltransferase PlsX [Clostridia bacterium]|nr:phosphate acyltransferase PlsX [Clostridia bacterium]
MKLVLDAMGGDLAPQINVDGAIMAAKAFPDVTIILAGPEQMVKDAIEKSAQKADYEPVKDRIEFLDAPEVISPEEHPVMALRKKKQSSFVLGMDLVRNGGADGFVSAGSTGALMAGAMFKLGRIKGIDRPALCALVPVPDRPLLLADSGANVDCKPEWILQFAMMGSVYMNKVMKLPAPEVGLLNIGVEEAKGNDQAKEAFQLMQAATVFKFIGNVEARDALAGNCDVLAADGFDGNVLIKNTEGTIALLLSLIKDGLMSSVTGKIAGLLAKKTFKEIKKKFDTSEIGGAPLLGVEGAVIKAHGNSDARAIFCAIRQARDLVSSGVVETIREGVAEMRAAQAKEAEASGKQEEQK